MQRIGVFVCHCGTNIAGTVDVKAVAAALANEPGVVISTEYQYMCSQAGQEMIKEAIRENRLTGIVDAIEGAPLKILPEQALRVVRVMEAAFRSAERGEAVKTFI